MKYFVKLLLLTFPFVSLVIVDLITYGWEDAIKFKSSYAKISVCEQYSGNVRDGCEDYFNFRKVAGKVVTGFFGVILASLLIPVIILIIVIIVIIVVVSRKKKNIEK